VIVNAEPTDMDSLADAVLRDQIGTVLPALVATDPVGPESRPSR